MRSKPIEGNCFRLPAWGPPFLFSVFFWHRWCRRGLNNTFLFGFLLFDRFSASLRVVTRIVITGLLQIHGVYMFLLSVFVWNTWCPPFIAGGGIPSVPGRTPPTRAIVAFGGTAVGGPLSYTFLLLTSCVLVSIADVAFPFCLRCTRTPQTSWRP